MDAESSHKDVKLRYYGPDSIKCLIGEAVHAASGKPECPQHISNRPADRYTASMDHDHSYKLLFSHPEMVADLLRGFVREDWVNELDFATLERVGGGYVADDLRGRHRLAGTPRAWVPLRLPAWSNG